MRRLLPTLVAAMFAAVTFWAYGADQPATGEQAQPQKQAKKKKKKTAKKPAQPGSSSVQTGGNQPGRGTPYGTAAPGGAVKAGGNEPGRGTPSGTAAPGGAVQVAPQQGAGRGSNQ